MTREEKIEKIAEFAGVNLDTYGMRFYNESNPASDTVDLGKPDVKILFGSWNPYEDWNHWRQVENKIMNGEELFKQIAEEIPMGKAPWPMRADDALLLNYIYSTLEERCDTLIFILTKNG